MKRNFFALIILMLFLTIAFPVDAAGVSFFLAPSKGTFFIGSTFTVSVFVNTKGNEINVVEVDLKFPPDILQVTVPVAGESFVSEWLSPPTYSNIEGKISFRGGIPGGVVTSAGLISTITFRARGPGLAKVEFLESSRVLLNDGKGTPVLATTIGGEYEISVPPPEGPKVFSPSHPDPDVWYNNKNPSFSWEKEEGMTDFSFALDQDPRGIPDNIPETPLTSANFTDISDGVWYFHLKAKKGDVWGGVSHFPIRIDTTPPENFEIKIERIGGITGYNFFAHFSSRDLLSGIDHYEISVVNINDPRALANPFFIEANSPYRIPYQSPGKYAILVKAYDKTGNFTEARSTLNIVSPILSYTEKGIRIKNLFLSWLSIYFSLGFLLMIGIFAIYNYLRKRGLRRRLRKEIAEAEKEIEDVRKLEKRIREMRILEEEARQEAERLAERLRRE